MDIDSMPAGREMDALVAERVMGWTNLGPCEFLTDGAKMGDPPPGFCWQLGRPEQRFILPRYSEEIADAWKVVEMLIERGDRPKLLMAYPAKSWTFVSYTVPSHADTAPLAISRAALKAMAVKP